MKKHARRSPLLFAERRRRWLARSGFDRVVEYFHYPSKRALEMWDYPLCIGTSRIARGSRFSQPAHGRGYLVHFVRRGELTHVLRGKSYVARQGDVCLLDRRRAHSQVQEKSATTELWWFVVDGRSMDRAFTELGADSDPVFATVDRERFSRLFHELWKLVSKRVVAQEPRMHAVIHSILAELYVARGPSWESASLVANKATLSEKVRVAVHLLEQLYQKNIGLKQIQSLVGMNLFNLSKRFRKEVGMPPIQYLNRYRIEIAKALLSSTNRPVSDVARQVGFVDPDYFARVFRHLAGASPQQFRLSVQEAGRSHRRSLR